MALATLVRAAGVKEGGRVNPLTAARSDGRAALLRGRFQPLTSGFRHAGIIP
jgi:hypothetical protein